MRGWRRRLRWRMGRFDRFSGSVGGRRRFLILICGFGRKSTGKSACATKGGFVHGCEIVAAYCGHDQGRKLILNLEFQIEGRTPKEPAERPSCFRVDRRYEKNDAADDV